MSGKSLKFLAVTTMRNEGAFLLEWLAHHRAVGFTDFLVFSNDCQDGTDTMLDRLAEMGQLTHIRNDGPHDKGGIQFSALKLADKQEIVRQADWVMTLDVDEFVNIHTGDRTLPALTAALPEASAITLTWRLFGNNDVTRFEDRPVTEIFTKCAPEVVFWPWRTVMFKTLYRNDGIYRKLGVHRPRSPDRDRLHEARWYDCEGRELGDQFKLRRLFSDYGRPNYRLAQLNHYALGAMESYLLKAERGRVNHSDESMGMDYWVERNLNTDTDTSIQQLAPISAPIVATFKQDGRLDRLHRDAVKWRHAKFNALIQQDPFRALFTRLLMTPPSRLVDASAARSLARHAFQERRNAQQNKPESG